ncbi:MAG: histidine phosphatase family protein [Lachnospiraceae bacterium]|jgi:alpha-ribazole phosphatase|nr:histidine phosphatase family protein [Lachnospiraceae bacterium]
MEMEIYLIRHGKTVGNREGRYIGSTDEPLSSDGRRELSEELWRGGYEGAGLHGPQAVYVSGLSRTKETARLLFPGRSLLVREGLNECGFGEFENHTYEELKENPAYEQWIESGGVSAPPRGEAKADFAARTIRAFEEAILEQLSQKQEPFCQERVVAFVVHGGSIMALLEHYSLSGQGFYHWQVKNGCGYGACLSEERWLAGEQNLTKIRSIP